MDSSIVGAIISAGASVLVAYLGRERSTPVARDGRSGKTSLREIPERNKRVWVGLIVTVLAWLVYAVSKLHWDTAGLTVLAIPGLGILAALMFPVRPNLAAAAMLLLCPIAFTAEPIAKLNRGMSISNHLEAATLAFQLGFTFVTALIVWSLSRRRLTRSALTTTSRPIAEVRSDQRSLTDELQRLSELHRAGELNDDEYAMAKRRLLASEP